MLSSLRMLCTKQRDRNIHENVFFATNIFQILSNSLPMKYNNLGFPVVLCTIGNTTLERAFFILGATVNLLPYTFYQQLGLGKFQSTKVTQQVPDHSVKRPISMVEDVLFNVNEFIFPLTSLSCKLNQTPNYTINSCNNLNPYTFILVCSVSFVSAQEPGQ